MMESTRQQKVARMLQREMGAFFQQNSRDMLPGKMITVTVVRVSPDLGVAKVFLSIFPVKEGEDPLQAVKDHAPKIRRDVGNKIRNQLRAIPEFIYYLDDSLDYIENIDNLLKED